MAAAKAHAIRHRVSLGEAVSALVRQAAQQPVATELRNGLHVVKLPSGSVAVTAAQVDRLLEDFP